MVVLPLAEWLDEDDLASASLVVAPLEVQPVLSLMYCSLASLFVLLRQEKMPPLQLVRSRRRKAGHRKNVPVHTAGTGTRYGVRVATTSAVHLC